MGLKFHAITVARAYVFMNVCVCMYVCTFVVVGYYYFTFTPGSTTSGLQVCVLFQVHGCCLSYYFLLNVFEIEYLNMASYVSMPS